MLTKIVSGAQTGADIAALRVAKRFGLATGGFMPHGWKAEDGSHPEYAARYGLQEHYSPDYPERTAANVRISDATLWIGNIGSPGYHLTRKCCLGAGKPLTVADPARLEAAIVAEWIGDVKCLNVAGNRESRAPGIGAAVEVYLADVLRALGFREREEEHG